MKLKNWKIDGFGVFSGMSLPEPGLCGGFNLIVGANEAGKSTLLDYLRYTLFGYPSGRTAPLRRPIRGGDHGGSVVLEIDDAPHLLHRRPRVKQGAFSLTGPDGAALSEMDFARHAGHVTLEVFKNVFGFSLSELQDRESLDAEQVRDLIFAASLGRTVKRVRELQTALEKRADAIFKENSRAGSSNAPRIIALRTELADIETKLSSARDESSKVGSLRTELEEALSSKASIDRESSALHERWTSIDQFVRGWEPFIALQSLEAERRELGEPSVTETDLEAWNELKRALATARERDELASTAVRDLESRLAALPSDFPLLAFANEIESLKTERPRYEAAAAAASTSRSNAAKARQEWSRIAEELGPSWSEELVLRFDSSLLTEDDAVRRGDAVRRTAEELSARGGELLRELRTARDASKECAALAARLRTLHADGPGESREEIERTVSRLGRFRDAIRERERLAAEARAADDHLTQVRLLARPSVSRNGERTSSQYLIALSAFLLAGAAAAFAGGYLILSAVCLGAAVLAAAAAFVGRTAGAASAQGAEQEVERAERRVESALAACDAHAVEWTASAGALGLAWPASEEGLRELEGRLAGKLSLLNRIDSVHESLVDARIRKTRAARSFSSTRADFESLRRASIDAAESWSGFLASRGMPEGLGPESAARIFHTVKVAKRLLASAAEHVDEAMEFESRAGDYLARTRSLLAGTGAPGAPDAKPDETLAALERISAAAAEEGVASRDRIRIATELERATLDLAALRDGERGVPAAERRAREFLSTLALPDEVALMRAWDRARKYRELSEAVRDQEQLLSGIFGRSGAPRELSEIWNSQASPPWEVERRALEERIAEMKAARDERQHRIGAIEQEMERLSESGTIAALQLEAESLRSQIRRGIEEWMDLTAELELLRLTRERFERENHSPALGEASRLFELVTDGKYRTIRADEAESDLFVLARDGSRIQPSDLSRGTRELLYLSVRLGFVRHYQEQQRISLPILMDDVTVNFDPVRMDRLFAALAECTARGQQILFFTCHENLNRFVPEGGRVFRLRDYEATLEIPSTFASVENG